MPEDRAARLVALLARTRPAAVLDLSGADLARGRDSAAARGFDALIA